MEISNTEILKTLVDVQSCRTYVKLDFIQRFYTRTGTTGTICEYPGPPTISELFNSDKPTIPTNTLLQF